jgi:arylsulfatase A-like enzyme
LPERLRNLFEGEKSRPVPNLETPAIYRRGSNEPSPKHKAVTQSGEAVVVPGHLEYFRHIYGTDENLGRLLKTLDDLGLTENTVVVYTSDNGYYLGEHGLGDKRSLYEESLRVPMLVRYPKVVGKGTINDELVLNIDVAPTFLELAGVSAPKEMQGKSWRPLLTGKKTEWRHSFLAEYFYENGFAGIPTVVGVRTTNAKLIKYPGHEEWTELFDLPVDPYETNNLISSEKDKKLREQLQAEFEKQVKATGYHEPAHADKPGEANPRKQGKKKKKQEQP